MFGHSVRFFRVFGIDIKIDLSWAFIAVFIAWTLAQGVFPRLYEGFSAGDYWWMAGLAVIGLALSIIIHELAHSLVAKAFGLPLKSITLFLFGGVAELEEEPGSPVAEFLMAIAGPATSAFLAVLFGLTAGAEGAQSALSSVVRYLSIINWMLAIFNLLPALPLDGGRVFRSLVWATKRDKALATRVSSRTGVFIGTAFSLLGVLAILSGQLTGGLWWVLIGLFIRGAAQNAVVQDRALRLYKGAPVEKFMSADPVCAAPDMSLRRFVDDYLYARHFDLFPVARDGVGVGVIGLKEVQGVAKNLWDRVTVGEVMSPLTPANTIDRHADALEALTAMSRNRESRLVVLDRERIVGVLAVKDLMDLLSLKLTLEPS